MTSMTNRRPPRRVTLDTVAHDAGGVAARVRVEPRSGGFAVRTRERRWNFAFNPQGRALLTLS